MEKRTIKKEKRKDELVAPPRVNGIRAKENLVIAALLKD